MVVINHPSKDKRYENLFAIKILWELVLILLMLFIASTVHFQRNNHEHTCSLGLDEEYSEKDPC
jgi:hypothetical protein